MEGLVRQSLTVLVLAGALAAACAHPSPGRSTASAERSVGNQPTTASPPQVVPACADAQVFFSSGSSSIDADGQERLDRYAGCLMRHETDVVYVAGMTDPGGSAEENLVLGRARARAVADYLHAAGCDTEFVIRSYGGVGALESEQFWPLERTASVTTAP